MKSARSHRIKFPCDCISATNACEEPWARVAKDGMFKDGTKEDLLNILKDEPRTIAQLAKEMDLSQPTIFRHISDLARHRLVREVSPDKKGYEFERYYKPNFPIVSREDQALFAPELESMAEQLAHTLRTHLPRLKKRFTESAAAREGWAFDEMAQYLVHAAQRSARTQLEEEGSLARELHSNGLDFTFWGIE